MKQDDDVIIDTPAIIEENITQKDLLLFAKLILLSLLILFVLSMITEILKPSCGIFESCKTILPPIATLIIGYYFGKSS